MPSPTSPRPRGRQGDPKYRHYKPKDLAVVRIDGRDIYLGRHGSPESWEKYYRVLAEWRLGGRAAPPAGPSGGDGIPDLSVNELLLAFWKFAAGYYRRPDGSPTAELDSLRLALRPLRRLYGGTPARDFGPMALKTVRQSMVDSGLCRRTVNQRTARLARVFRFGAENELVPAAVYHALKAVPGLRSGRSGAKEGREVRPVPDGHVEVVLPYLSRQLRAVVELQRWTGMRSGEALAMRGCDLDTSGPVWVYTPGRHKGEVHGKQRQVFLGPKAQQVVRGWLRDDPTEHLFQPGEAKEEHLAGRRRARVTPLTPSQRARTRKASPRRAPGDHYGTRAYCHAVGRACEKAGIPRWHPHQLRHSAATDLRKEFGLDLARIILGHSSLSVTESYAEVDREKAIAVMARVG
jgi:integrase